MIIYEFSIGVFSLNTWAGLVGDLALFFCPYTKQLPFLDSVSFLIDLCLVCQAERSRSPLLLMPFDYAQGDIKCK